VDCGLQKSIYLLKIKGSILCFSAMTVFLKLKRIGDVSQPPPVAAWGGGASCAIRGASSDVDVNSGACGIYCVWCNSTEDLRTRKWKFAVFFSMSLVNI
jgi:hypothetical protein